MPYCIVQKKYLRVENMNITLFIEILKATGLMLIGVGLIFFSIVKIIKLKNTKG